MKTRSYVNGIRTHAGGTHENGLRNGIVKAVRNYLEVHDIKHKGVTLTGEDIREGAIGVLSVFHSDPMFQGQTKERLNNPELTGVVEGIVRPGIETWLNGNPSIADAIIGRIVLAARARMASRDAASEVRRKTPGSHRTNLPGKLLDCRQGNPEKSELFVVEGDSAGGTAAMGRDNRTQAVLPLRGKILNTESLALSKILENQEVKDLIEALGTGIGPSFDFRKLRYGRVVLLMDADSDGYHITTLLLTFFFRHMRELITQGRLFIAQPPLYRIVTSNEVLYAQDDAAKEEILARWAPIVNSRFFASRGSARWTPNSSRRRPSTPPCGRCCGSRSKARSRPIRPLPSCSGKMPRSDTKSSWTRRPSRTTWTSEREACAGYFCSARASMAR